MPKTARVGIETIKNYCTMKKRLLPFILVFSMATSCEKCICDGIELADLVIPQALHLLDPNGNPMYYPNGAPLQDANELYYNYRTGELFTHLFPSVFGVILGDILDIGTRVFNNWVDNNCEKGTYAPQSYTSPALKYSGPAGTGSISSLQPHLTPGIPQNFPTGGFTFTTFGLDEPGYYKVDFNANHNRLFEEHSFGNNLYNGSSGGSQFGKSIDASIVVSEGVSTEPWVSEPPTCVVAECEFYKQFDSGTSEATYLASPLARFMQDPKNLAAFYQFKMENPDKPFILK
jgi:hypothetical protein